MPGRNAWRNETSLPAGETFRRGAQQDHDPPLGERALSHRILRLATGARLTRSGTSLAGATFRLHPCSPMRNGPYPLFVRTRPTRPARRTILEQSRSRRPSCASNRQPFIPRHLNFSRACGCGSLLARAGCWAAGIAHMAHHCDKISSVIDTTRTESGEHASTTTHETMHESRNTATLPLAGQSAPTVHRAVRCERRASVVQAFRACIQHTYMKFQFPELDY